MEVLTSSNLVVFVAFVVPGFLSLQVYGLLRPRDKLSLKDNLLEALAFGIVNLALMSWAVVLISDPEFVESYPFWAYVVIVLVLFVAPIIWPVALFFVLEGLAARRLILERSPTSWDHFFKRREPCWIIVHLEDGRRFGGRFDTKSYASSYPMAGHICVEELWHLGENGEFLEKVDSTKGMILRPEDYVFIELFESEVL